MKNYIHLSKPFIDSKEKKAVLEVLDSGMLAQGPRVKKLEEQFAKLCGVKYALAISNGTAALHTALHAIGIKPGDEVITTPLTFAASANSILMVGAKPVFVDIDEKTYNIDPAKIESAITPKTKAILAVNIYGQPADFQAINKIAKKHNLLVIEDAAQSVNADYQGKKSGNLAPISTFSFYATKNMMTGEGGMITTNSKKFYEKAKAFRHHGQDEHKRYQYSGLGFNYRMTDIQGALGIEQLKKLNQATRTRQNTASRYARAFSGKKSLTIPYVQEKTHHVYHQYVLRITPKATISRDRFMKLLDKKGIGTNIHYPVPLYAVKHLGGLANRKNFPVTERAIKEIVSIPIHPLLKEKEIDYIIMTIQSYVQ